QARATEDVRRVATHLGTPGLAGVFTDPAVAARFASTTRQGMDILAVRRPDGSVVGSAATSPGFLNGASVPSVAALAAATQPAFAVLSEIVVTGPRGAQGSIVGGFWLDRSFASSLTGARALIVVGGEVVAATDPAVHDGFHARWRIEGSLLAGRVAGT